MDALPAANRLREASGFSKLITRVDGHWAKAIDEYIETLPSTAPRMGGAGAAPAAKAFKDAIWGMVDLDARETIVLDSPPIQRLRRVRQLGLSYLTYPTAGYSRFEHTIGAIHQASRMLGAVRRRSDPEADVTITAATPVVRLAAMLHDVGHLPLSHVSERYYSQAECCDDSVLDEIEEWTADVVDVLEVPAPSVAELLSVALVLTPSFDRLAHRAGFDDTDVATAALAIIGRPPSLRLAFVAQLITNVLDADKLDYMFRDAYVTGVPMAVDLERLLYKLKCVSVDAKRLPGGLKNFAMADERAWVLGTDVAGHRLAYDVAVSRSMLFERIYLHHKTRAAERVALRILSDVNMHPADLLSEDDSLFSMYAEHLPAEGRKWARALRNRQLPRRVLAVSYSFLLGTAVLDPSGRPRVSQRELEGWSNLESDLDLAERRSRLEQDIASASSELASKLGEELDLAAVWLDTLPNYLQSDDPELLLERPDGTMDAGASFPAEAAAFAHSPAKMTYLYAKGSERTLQLVHLAAELEFAKTYGLVFGRAAADHAKLSFSALEEIKRELEAVDASVYEENARLRPQAALLRRETTRERLDALARRFHQFHAHAEVRVDRDHLVAFLDQFPEPLILPMVTVLESLHFVSRDQLGKEFLAGARTAHGRDVFVPLSTAMRKSAGHMAYYFDDAPDDPPPVLPMAQALKTEADLIVFDDVLISGTQAVDQVRVWFGRDASLDEDFGEPLGEGDRDLLKQRAVQFRFAWGYEPGLARLRETLRELGMPEDVDAVHKEPEGPGLGRALGGAELDRVRAHLENVGKALLMSTKHEADPARWTEQRCRERALGYGNAERLVVLPYNTPTGTVTALWKGGTYGSTPWLPLIPRRGELGEPE